MTGKPGHDVVIIKDEGIVSQNDNGKFTSICFKSESRHFSRLMIFAKTIAKTIRLYASVRRIYMYVGWSTYT